MMFEQFLTASFSHGDYYIIDTVKNHCILNFSVDTWSNTVTYDHQEIKDTLESIFDVKLPEVLKIIEKDYPVEYFGENTNIIIFCIDL